MKKFLSVLSILLFLSWAAHAANPSYTDFNPQFGRSGTTAGSTVWITNGVNITNMVAKGTFSFPSGAATGHILASTDANGVAGWTTNIDALSITNLNIWNSITIKNGGSMIIQGALAGDAFKVIGGSSNALTNGLNLVSAWATAKTTTPHGAALSIANRYTLFLLPGVYDLGSATFAIDAQFIDLVGLSPNTGKRLLTDGVPADMGDTIIKSSGTTMNLSLNANTHDNILANLCIYTSDGTQTFSAITTAYTGFGTDFRVYNCLLVAQSGNSHAMPWDKSIDGLWVDVRCYNTRAFGKGVSSAVTINGTFIRCIMGDNSMGGEGSAATISGTLIDCYTTGSTSRSIGTTGDTVSGTFLRVRAIGTAGILGGTVTSTAVAEDCAGGSVGTSFGTSTAMAGTLRGCSGVTGFSSVTGTIQNCSFSAFTDNLIASKATDAAVNIAATGWTNTFGKNATVYFDGGNIVFTVFNNALTSVYTNAVAVSNATVNLQPAGKVIITGNGVAGRAVPF